MKYPGKLTARWAMRSMACSFGLMLVSCADDKTGCDFRVADFNAIASAVKGYKLNGGCYPSTEQGLDALINRPETEPLPRKWIQVMKKIPLDPWDREYRYRLLPDGKNFEIRSVGPDGIWMTKDDISSLAD